MSISLSLFFFFFAFEQTYQTPTLCKVPAGHLILMTAKWKVDISQMEKQEEAPVGPNLSEWGLVLSMVVNSAGFGPGLVGVSCAVPLTSLCAFKKVTLTLHTHASSLWLPPRVVVRGRWVINTC